MKKWAVVLSAIAFAVVSHQVIAKDNAVYLYTWSKYVLEDLFDDFIT